MRVLFTLTLFVSALLLFCVQPMIAKMILPLLGGTPAVWNTCMVFFQAILLAGYAYAHALTYWLETRRQVLVHMVLLLSAILILPIGLAEGWAPPNDRNPIPWLLALLLVSIGLPFFVLSTTAPLLQKWFAGTGHAAASDPYFLYGASNLGSMLALLGYPLVIEPFFSLDSHRWLSQNWLWSCGYAILVLLVAGCAIAVWVVPPGARKLLDDGEIDTHSAGGNCDVKIAHAPRLVVRVRWVALALVPSCLLLAVTTYITTDIAPVPLLWVIPLALYLLSFILVFASRPLVPASWAARALPMAVLVTAFTFFFEAVPMVGLPLHLATFFLACLVCHGELARDRPPARYLTGFYLCISLGGVLGGLANALVAPLVFTSLAEYPIALVLLCLLRPDDRPATSNWSNCLLDVCLPVAVGSAVAAGLIIGMPAFGLKPAPLAIAIICLPILIACYSFKDRPFRFATGLGVLLLIAGLSSRLYDPVLCRERTFFGRLRVIHDLEGNFHTLAHGSTIHGRQSLDPNHRNEPLTYYHRTGPIGQVFEVFTAHPASHCVGVVGLGAGSLASYALPDQNWTFFEIDPAVERIARDPRYFTYLQDCQTVSLRVMLGDARLRLKESPGKSYGLLVLDAFSSDSIPVHLLTREALQLYVDKLADGGIIAFHVTNNYVDMRPVLAQLASDARLACRVRDDNPATEEEVHAGKSPSRWVIMARKEADLGKLAADARWQDLPGVPGASVWTDDFSNIVTILTRN